jgi:hypothetical protein
MESAQILNGTIDPNWVLTLIVGVTAFLLVRILNRIEKKQEVHDNKLEDHEVRITVIERDK